ncbi:VOC family protein [Fusibacter bizertensis]
MDRRFLTSFITLPGTARKAIKLYQEVFSDTELVSMDLYKDSPYGADGTVINAQLRIKDTLIMLMDMSEEHAAEASWMISLFVDCQSEPEFDEIFNGLSKNGIVIMGPEPIMALRKVAWVTDAVGVTWQLVWA